MEKKIDYTKWSKKNIAKRMWMKLKIRNKWEGNQIFFIGVLNWKEK